MPVPAAAVAVGLAQQTRSPFLPAAPTRRPSPLNPNRSSAAAPHHGADDGTAAARATLENLDRVLKKPPLPPSEAPTAVTAAAAPVDGPPAGTDAGRVSLFSALNLASFIPAPTKLLSREGVAAMSPRSLTYLQRLLSADSPRESPRGSLAGERWRLLHGAHGWAGLLDPLDADLRRELLRYGDFVQAAYHAFHSLPEHTGPPSHRGLLLPDRSFRPTKSLFATSSLSLPPWAQRPGTPAWLTQRSSWIGYVAVCHSEREVARMGRREIVIVLRGTATCLEWAENLRASLVPLADDGDSTGAAGADVPKVARGFLSLYKTPGEHVPSLSTAVIDEVRRLMDVYKGEELSVTVVGHSLGAALALLVADEVSTCVPNAPPVCVVSFGGPKVGNRAFTERLTGRGDASDSGRVSVLRIVNSGDVVTRVPGLPALWGPARTRDGYEHAGVELRVDNHSSPFLRHDAGPACSHDLEAYLHLVDGFTATGGPFRPDARRSVVRLLQLQRGNVKSAYLDREQELGVDLAAGSAATRGSVVYSVASP